MTVLHIVSILSILSALAIGFFRLHTGLLILTFFGPFFTLLHEMSPGSPVYFLWPFALCGVMVLSIVCREMLAWNYHTSEKKRTVGLLWCAGVFTASLLGIVWGVDGLQTVFLDVDMAEFPVLLGNKNMAILSIVMSVVLILFLGVYFREMRRRERRYHLLDFAVATFLIYGLFQVVYTTTQSGVVFVGLDGFRYYFFMAVVYFLARYSIRRSEQEHQLLVALGLACFVGAIQFMAEGYMLNVLKISPKDMPWVGHLVKNWDYLPEGNRAFFKGGYRPLGLMYMTHFSGLFLLFGLALWLPRLVIVRRWKDSVIYGIPVLVVSVAAFWTSRTVLLLLAGLYVGAAALMRASWPRVLGGGITLGLFFLVSSSHVLPVVSGFYYDFGQELKYTASSALPDTLNAIKVDWRTITGEGKKRQREIVDETPPGWRFFPGIKSEWGQGAYTKRVTNDTINGPYALAVGSGVDSRTWVRRVLNDTRSLRGKEIVIGAWLKAATPRLVWVSLDEYFGPRTESAYHSGSGKWEFITVKHNVHALSENINVDIIVEQTNQDVDVALVDGVYLVAAGQVVALMSHPSGFPYEMFPGLNEPSHSLEQQSASKTLGLRGELLTERKPSFEKIHHYLFGRGTSFWGWSALFFPTERRERTAFTAASYSDFKYLEFFEQFGALGIIVLLTMGVLSLTRGVHASLEDHDPQSRATRVGLTLIVFTGFLAMFHLPSMFKVGINSSVYLIMAMLMRESGESM